MNNLFIAKSIGATSVEITFSSSSLDVHLSSHWILPIKVWKRIADNAPPDSSNHSLAQNVRRCFETDIHQTKSLFWTTKKAGHASTTFIGLQFDFPYRFWLPTCWLHGLHTNSFTFFLISSFISDSASSWSHTLSPWDHPPKWPWLFTLLFLASSASLLASWILQSLEPSWVWHVFTRHSWSHWCHSSLIIGHHRPRRQKNVGWGQRVCVR